MYADRLAQHAPVGVEHDPAGAAAGSRRRTASVAGRQRCDAGAGNRSCRRSRCRRAPQVPTPQMPHRSIRQAVADAQQALPCSMLRVSGVRCSKHRSLGAASTAAGAASTAAGATSGAASRARIPAQWPTPPDRAAAAQRPTPGRPLVRGCRERRQRPCSRRRTLRHLIRPRRLRRLLRRPRARIRLARTRQRLIGRCRSRTTPRLRRSRQALTRTSSRRRSSKSRASTPAPGRLLERSASLSSCQRPPLASTWTRPTRTLRWTLPRRRMPSGCSSTRATGARRWRATTLALARWPSTAVSHPTKKTQSYVSTIMGNAQKAADAAGTTISGAVPGGPARPSATRPAARRTEDVQQAASNVLPAISQFGDKQACTAAEAYAACGPAAAGALRPTVHGRSSLDLARGNRPGLERGAGPRTRAWLGSSPSRASCSTRCRFRIAWSAPSWNRPGEGRPVGQPRHHQHARALLHGG